MKMNKEVRITGQEILELKKKKQFVTKKDEDIQGVYCIENLVNGKCYVGSAGGTKRGIRKRWSSHVFEFDTNRHGNLHLQKAWNKYGAENFLFYVLEQVDGSLEEIRQCENKWFQIKNVFENGYNQSKNANGGGWLLTEDYIKTGKSKQCTWEQYLYIKDKLINSDMPLIEIAKNAGCKEHLIKNIYQRRTLVEEFQDYVFPARKANIFKLTEQDYNKIVKLYLENISVVEIGKRYKISPAAVSKILTEYNVKTTSVSKDSGKKGLSVKVYQYDLKGNYLQSFNSIKKAASSCKGADEIKTSCKITDCCQGRHKTAYGYRWSYNKLDCLPPLNLIETFFEEPLSDRFRPIIQYDLNWNPINMFRSLRGTKEISGSKYQTISRNIKLNRNDTETFGFKRKWAEEAPSEDIEFLIKQKGLKGIENG